MNAPTGFRADSVRIRRASIAIPTRYVTPRESVVEHASYLTAGAVDNPPASAATAPGSDVACNASGENPRWVL